MLQYYFDKAARVLNAWVTPEVNADNVLKRCHVESIKFDQRFGHGATPLHRQLRDRCLMAMLTPNHFFRLIGEQSDKYLNDPFYTDWLTRGGAIASPLLSVNFGNGDAINLPAITSHEGRHRMGAILARYGDIAVPVALYPAGRIRLPQVTTPHIRNLRGPVMAQNGGIVSPTGIGRVYSDGKRIEISDLLAKHCAMAHFTR